MRDLETSQLGLKKDIPGWEGERQQAFAPSMTMSLDQPVMVAALAPATEPVTDPLDPQVPAAVPKPAEVQAAELTHSA